MVFCIYKISHMFLPMEYYCYPHLTDGKICPTMLLAKVPSVKQKRTGLMVLMSVRGIST